MLEITIIVDENDGDYLTEVSKITQKEFETVLPLIKAIKKNHGRYQVRDHVDGVKMTEMYPLFPVETHKDFEDMCPCPEYGFGSIESLTISPYFEKTTLI